MMRSAQLRIVDEVRSIPATRADCIDGPRPCPHYQCRFHLHPRREAAGRRWSKSQRVMPYIDRGLAASCTLDVVDENPDGVRPAEVASMIHTTSERVRQIVDGAARGGQTMADRIEDRVQWCGECPLASGDECAHPEVEGEARKHRGGQPMSPPPSWCPLRRRDLAIVVSLTRR